MSLRRYAAKRDAAEPAIVDALRKVGVFVVILSDPNGPDLLCRRQRGRKQEWTPLEVKTGKKKPTKGQAEAGYPVVRTVDEALTALGVRTVCNSCGFEGRDAPSPPPEAR